MKYILIAWFLSYGEMNSIAVEFNNKASCMEAAKQIISHHKVRSMGYICAQKTIN